MEGNISKHFQNKLHTRTVALAGLFVALNIILTRFLSFTIGGTFRVGFGLVPLHLAGYLLGPVWGLVVGVVSDLLGVVLNSFGQMPHPGFTLSSGLHGLIPGLTVHLWTRIRELRWGDKRTAIPAVIVSGTVTMAGVSWLLRSIWISQLFNVSYAVTAAARAVPALVQGIVLIITELLLLVSRFSVRLNRSAS